MSVTTTIEADQAAPAPADSVYMTAQASPDADQVREALKFTKADWVLAGFGILLATGVSFIGLASSYKALERKAALPANEGGWAWSEPWMLPIGLDLSILAFSIVNLLLIRVDRPAAWVKWVPRLGAGGTVYLNWVSAGNLASQIGHAVLASLWVVFSEIAAHVYAAQIDQIHHRPRMEGARISRWLLDPIATAQVVRLMKLWEITSYQRALELFKDRQIYRQLLTQRYGKKWKRTAPTDALMPLTLARLGLTVAEALDVPADAAAEEAVREHEAGVRARALALRLREEEATAALAEVQRQAEVDAANARAEAERLRAQAELAKAREEARTAADAVVRQAELDQKLKEEKATAEAERLRAEAAAQAAEATAAAEARAAEIRREQEKAQLKWEAEQTQLRLKAEQAEVAARQETERLEREHREQQAAAEAEAQRLLAQKQKEAAEAAEKAAEARRKAAEDAKLAAVTEAEAAVTQAEAEQRAAAAKAAKAAAEAQAAELEKAMAVALEAASVAHENARRTPAERQALIVADMIEKFGEEVVTLSYIEKHLGITGGTRQDRRDRARQIVAERRNRAADGRDDLADAA
ncbi:DUF2637 domain-containing protein [Kitasatospora aureofaciens]|uniref:DUF2637 domain-containing protein n=1 Tax=Kitasatospora aureofaciens TaxID=1894 RepID=UPI0033B365DD